jgi:hypothetical protein
MPQGRDDDGKFARCPAHNRQDTHPGIAAEDIGRCSYGISQQPASSPARPPESPGEHATGSELAAAFANALGHDVAYRPVGSSANLSACRHRHAKKEIGSVVAAIRDNQNAAISLSPRCPSSAAFRDRAIRRRPHASFAASAHCHADCGHSFGRFRPRFGSLVASGRFPERLDPKLHGLAVGDIMQTNRITKTAPEKAYRRVLSAGTLTGDSVRNAAGEDLGKIDEIMIDIPSGRVAYAVLSFGGFLGMGDKLFAVPWNALKVNEDEKCFILNIDKRRIEQAPGFDKQHWPDMSDPSFASELSTYYQVRPYSEEREKTLTGGGGL